MFFKRTMALILALTMCFALALPGVASADGNIADPNAVENVPEGNQQGTEEQGATYYKVEFNTNGGVETYADQFVKEGECAVAPADPTQEGFDFSGWYETTVDEGNGDRYISAEPYDFATPVKGELLLTAMWTSTMTKDELDVILTKQVRSLKLGDAAPMGDPAPSTYVAKIGETEYTSLQEAINAAQDGNTVELLKEVTGSFTINKSLTLKVADDAAVGTKIVGSGTTALLINASNVTVNLNNIVISKGATRGVCIDANCTGVTLNITGGSIAADSYALDTRPGADNANVTINSTDLDGWAAMNIWGNYSTFNISGSNLVGANTMTQSSSNDFAVIALEADTTARGAGDALAGQFADGNSITLTNCTIGATTTTNKQAILVFNAYGEDNEKPTRPNAANYLATGKHAKNNTVSFANCIVNTSGDLVYDGASILAGQSGSVISDTYNNKFIVTGGTYTSDPTAYLANGYKAVESNSTYNVVPKVYVAQIGETKYETLADAIAAVPTDGTETTITMIADSAESGMIEVAATKNIILDLAGHEVSATASGSSWRLIANKGTLTIKDSSKQSTGKLTAGGTVSGGELAVIYNLGGTLNLQSGTIEYTGNYGISYAVSNSSNAWGVKDDKETVFTMTGGKLSAAYGDAGLRVYQNCAQGNTPFSHNTVTISNGYIDGGIFVDTYIYNPNASTTGDGISTNITINGGTINGLIDLKLRHPFNTHLTINDGTFTNSKLWVRKYSEWNPVIAEPETPFVTINDGKFSFVTGKAFGLAYDCGATSWTSYTQPYYVSGGVFNVDLNEYSSIKFPTGKTGVPNTDESTKEAYPYTVGVAAVAQIGETTYTTLAAAFDAVKDGETIKLVADVDDSTMGGKGIVVNGAKTITLDLSGYNITCTDGSAANNRMITIKGTTTLNVVNNSAATSTMNVCGEDASKIPYGVFRNEVGTTLNITATNENIVLKNGRKNGLNVKVLGGVANLNGVVINSTIGGGIEVTEADLDTQNTQPGKATLDDCTFNQNGYGDWCSTALSVSGGSELIVNSGTYTGEYALYVFSSGGVINVKNGTFAGLGNDNRAAIVAEIDTHSYPKYTGGLKIEGGKFTGTFKITSPAYAEISGGYFTADPTAYKVEGYDVVDSDLPAYDYMVQQHVHRYDHDKPNWSWKVVNGVWSATVSYPCVMGDAYEVVQAVVTKGEVDPETGVVTYTATDSEHKQSATKPVVETYTVTYNNEKTYFKYGTAFKAGEEGGTKYDWYVRKAGEEESAAVPRAKGTSVFYLPVIEDVTVTSVACEDQTKPQEPVTSASTDVTIDSTTNKATVVYHVAWSLPEGAQITSEKIYRATSSINNQNVTEALVIEKGAQFIVDLNVRNGDYTYTVKNVPLNKDLHLVLEIKYTLPGENGTKVLTDYRVVTVSGN